MLTPGEIDYLNKIPKDKKVKVYPFDPKATEVAEETANSIHKIHPDLEIKHMGASALKISGQNDIDIYALSNSKHFDKYLPRLVKLFGEPLHKHKTFVEWKFKKSGFDIEFYLTEPPKEHIKIFESLKSNPDLLKEYEALKESMNGKSFREYQEKKYEFYHRILDTKIKAILFDMVGVLIFKKVGYIVKTKEEINAENIERLFNHLDDQKLISDIKIKLNLSDSERENACRFIPEKYERFEKLWTFLPKLKEKYKLAVINNGNSVALRYWKEKFDFNIFDLFINSAVEGIKKPNPKIFLLACKKLNVEPNECLFMDDSSENIESAKNLGMKTIWWNKEEDKLSLMSKFEKNVN